MHTMAMTDQWRRRGHVAIAKTKALGGAVAGMLGLALWLSPGNVQAGSGLALAVQWVPVATSGTGVSAAPFLAPFAALGQVLASAQTQRKSTAKTATKTKAKTKVKRTSVKKSVATASPERTASGETVANRERRLARECKGRPNAGACMGYAN